MKSTGTKSTTTTGCATATEEEKKENKSRIQQFIETLYVSLEQWSPIVDSIGAQKCSEHLPSVPTHPIQCTRDDGAPRPKSHHLHAMHEKKDSPLSGYHVSVGNVGVNDGPYDLVLTLVVDNLVKGALGAALQLLEYTLMVTKARE